MDLTDRILDSLRGRLGITVCHPNFAGALKVTGASIDTVRFGWLDLPEEMKVVGRMVYCCQADWSADTIFVFDDEVSVVDAHAHMVVEAMLDMMDSDAAYDLQHPRGEDEDEDDWICEGGP